MDDVDLTKLICALLGELPGWEYVESDPFPPGTEVAVSYGSNPDTPDAAVGVRVYGAIDSLSDFWSARRVQLIFRGARRRPDGADALADLAFAKLQGLSRVGGISGISRTSASPLGPDKGGREERSDNYTITLDNPEASEL